MKPSEALTAIQMLGALVKDLEARAEGARALDTSIRSEMDARTIDLETAGERAAALVTEEYGGPEELAPFAAIVADTPIPYKLSEPKDEARVRPVDPGRWLEGDRVKHTKTGQICILGPKNSLGYFVATQQDGSPWELDEQFLFEWFTLIDRAPHGRKADGAPKKAPGRRPILASTLQDRAPERSAPHRETVDPSGGPRPVQDFDAPPKSPEGLPLVAPGCPKAHVAPLTSPLTDDLRAKLERTLGAAPMTAESIARMSWAVDLDVERITALLCEAPETFIRWQREERVGTALTKVDVWGLPHQFDGAVKMLTVPSQEPARSARTSEALGCSVSAALAAWARLDPGAT